jgi:16S rRNA (cytosine1402-N4)-methyltransferase
LEQEGFFPLSGALFDLGVSSLQLDKPSRGFSFMREGPLDMRLGPDASLTAESIVNRWPAEQISMLLKEFGEEPEADRIARAIVARRTAKPLTSTLELADCVESVVARTGHHPATRTFQALRIAVNQELEALTRGLEAVVPYLKNGGRLCVITFHSLEDRIVKNVFASFVSQGSCVYLGKGDAKSAINPGEAEIARNPRSRSAKLRVIEKR